MGIDHTAIQCYVALGSNLDDPVAQISTALRELNALPETTCNQVSSIYRSRPMGPPNQPDFINAVAELATGLEAAELLKQMLQIEIHHGRQRSRAGATKNGPRTLDLDLLLYGDYSVDEPGLTLPHPGLAHRDFVLLPLLEIAPNLAVSGLGPLGALKHKSNDYGAVRGEPLQWQR
ncbi:MAG: 2-amino-4-hydroxy-6-hydroxymethyldihydropteridine diphosphokinase [Gammaproteobacteria bacterium]